MQEYVCGFYFFEHNKERNVLLIHKTKPKWQAGLFNGIGGKIEAGESAVTAMVREFYEEADVSTCPLDWKQYAVIEGKNYRVYFFKAFFDTQPHFRSKTEEQVIVFDSAHLPQSIVKSNKILIPLALQSEFFDTFIRESEDYKP